MYTLYALPNVFCNAALVTFSYQHKWGNVEIECICKVFTVNLLKKFPNNIQNKINNNYIYIINNYIVAF